MNKKIYFILFFIVILLVAICSMYIGYKIYDEDANNKNIVPYKAEVNTLTNEKPVDNIKTEKISPSTKMVYEYIYKDDNITETVEDVPPYFLIDLTRTDLENNFKDWQVKSFSNKEVVLQKAIEGESTQHYIIGEYDGYVAVFYEKEINGTKIKEITDISISSLPKEEQEKLKKGINIIGKLELIKFLEDYSS